MAYQSKPLEERIREGIKADQNGCWIWQGGKNSAGYGRIWIGSRTDGTRRQARVHRIAYELFVGSIPNDLPLDHLCRVPSCCNPAHLEPVTLGENLRRGYAPAAQNARKTHCPHGHEYTPENTRVSKGKRYCRACRQESRSK